MINKVNYFSDEIFELEKKTYFAQNFCLGSTTFLNVNGDYRTFNNYFIPITVRFLEEISVFKNVCLHRSSLIDIAESGNSPFDCKYHGWAYSHDGSLKRVPLDSSINVCGKKLEKIPSNVIDDLIFINSDHKFENNFKSIFLESGIKKSSCFYRNSLLHKCNWKLLVENVLEPYHISFVHKDSFVPLGLTSTSIYSWRSTPLGTYNIVQSRSDEKKYYSHVDIAPNLFVSDTNGHVVFLSYFIPISVNETILHYELWESPELIRRAKYTRDFVKNESIIFSNKVLMEDKEIVEAAQVGIKHASSVHNLSNAIEPRVIEFHKRYMEMVK
jgi:phenylpropionate dioxygenase-like ring-hydroxylating dioxygenase large terminal subunit